MPRPVRALLGPPDYSSAESREWDWEIGVPPPRSDYEPLTVRFGADGRVARVRVRGFIEP